MKKMVKHTNGKSPPNTNFINNRNHKCTTPCRKDILDDILSSDNFGALMWQSLYITALAGSQNPLDTEEKTNGKLRKEGKQNSPAT